MLRFRISQRKNKRRNIAFAEKKPMFIFPPDYFIYETFTLDYKLYFEDGFALAQNIKAAVEPLLNLSIAPKAILDWGCGPGRVVRHLPAVFGSNHDFYGCDYNGKYVDWCRENLTDISFFINDLLPPLGKDDESYDLIFGFSILTHLSEDAHRKWMAEFHRLLKPGGILLVTTQGDASAFKLTGSELANYKAGNFVGRYFETEGHRMYSAFHSEKFMEKLADKFHLRRLIRGEEDGDFGIQDAWVLQK